ncbi:hypothetical protein ACIOWK_32790 [Pseudomonas protegens]|uniref:hypothetical protein n=1 Tax=Pseudomonas protegens TaxID=380021 RepID=UPI0037FDDE82
MTTPVYTAQEIAHDALEELENARLALCRLEAIFCAAAALPDDSRHIHHLIGLGLFYAADAANLASLNCEAIGHALLACAPQNENLENVALESGVPSHES